MDYKILVVDDDKEIVNMLKEKLTKEGYIVSTACDGEDALAKVKTDKPDIILLDLMMPKLNGFETLKQIRDNFQDRWMPIIILSAKAELESVKQCYSMEADHYLTKPCEMEKLLRGIETMISLIPLRKTKDQ
jgi:DNA-binding response OmpR family regulator